MAFENGNIYGNGSNSTIGNQYVVSALHRQALIDVLHEMYFTPLASSRAMPKHFGKTIQQFHYLPLLDDRNVNDQGIDASGAVISDGNLYGSSKDIGTIPGKLPTLSETGGRVNRVGYSRITLQATLAKLGFFDEYTQESMDFDNDAELESHMTREALRAATYMSEAALQIDLLNGAGVIRFPEGATSNATVSGEVGEVTEVSYGDLMRLNIDLDNNRCPKSTKIIKGSRMIDTRTVNSARYLYIGTELIPSIRGMLDLTGAPAFIPVERYADAGNVMNGEIGTIDMFRIIVSPDMLNWTSAGADENNNAGYRATAGNYDVFPMLAVGSESFTTIAFRSDGKTSNFKINHQPPSAANADRNDPYGETGFHSIKWYYATMILRPEWIGLMKTVAKI